MAITRYTPQFIERQYVPTNVNAAIDVMGKMQGQYDRGLDMQQQALSEAYGMKSTQGFEAGRNQFAENLKSQIDKAIESRGGDAGAALRDIQGAIINAKKDPFIRANEYNLDQHKRFQDAYDRNKNALVIRDPNTIQYKPGMSQEDMNYSLLDPEDVRKMAQIDYAGEAGKKFQGIFRDSTGKYNLQKHSYGPSEERINDILNDPKALERLKQYYPQTQGMDLQKADKFFRGALESTLRSMKKGDEVDVIGVDPDYMNSLRSGDSGQSNKSSFVGATPYGTTLVPEDADKNYAINKKSIDKDISREAEALKLSGVTSLNDLREYAKKHTSRDIMSDPDVPRWQKIFIPAAPGGTPIKIGKNTPDGLIAQKLLGKWESKISKTDDDKYTYKMWDINPMSPDPKEAKYNKDNSDIFSEKMKSQIGEMSFAGSKDEDAYKKIKSGKKIGTIKVNRFVIPSQVSPAAIEFVGEDESGEPIKFMKYVNDKAANGILVENQIKDFVRRSPGMMGDVYRTFEQLRAGYDSGTPEDRQNISERMSRYLSESGTKEEKRFRLNNIKSFFPELIKD